MRRQFLTGIILVLMIISNCIHAKAQKPEWIRNSNKTINAPYGETYPKRVVAHPDGSVFVLGQFSGSNTFSDKQLVTNPGVIDDAFLAKYNVNGDLLWVKALANASDSYSTRVLDIKVDNQGYLIFSGSCLWLTSILGSTVGNGQFIGKLNKDGELQWLNFAPKPGGSIAEHDVSRRGNRIGFDSDNNILWFLDQINEYAGTGGLAVKKYKPDGSEIATMFVTHNPSFYRENMQDFSVHADGSFSISGNFESRVTPQGGPLITNIGSNVNPFQFFIAKFTSTGQFLWVIYSRYGSNVLTCHTSDDKGNLYVGLQLDYGADIYTPQGIVNVPQGKRVIARILSNGTLDWMNSVGATNLEDIFMAPDGLLYLTGLAWSKEFKYQSYQRTIQNDAAFILRISSDGNFRGAYFGEPIDLPTTQSGASVWGYQSVVDNAGNIYTVGGSWDGQNWGCVAAYNDYYSFFLVKHSPVASPIHEIVGPGTICEGTTITLSTDLVSNGVYYRWFAPDSTDPEPGAFLKNSIIITTKNTDNNKPVIVSIRDNCDEYFAEPYILKVPALPHTPVFVTGKELVCPGASQEYKIGNVNVDNNYQWVLSTGIFAPNETTSEGGTFSFSSDFQQGEVRVIASNLCGTAQSTYKINAYKVPSAPKLTGNQQICPGIIAIHKFIQPVEDALSYQWELPSNISFDPQFITNRSSLDAITNIEFQGGLIRVRAVGHCKMSEASTPITISRAPRPADPEPLSGPHEICISAGTATYTLPTIEFVTQYVWSIPNVFDKKGTLVTSEPRIVLNAQHSGIGALSVRGVNECYKEGLASAIDITAYENLPPPVLNISACDTEITVTNGDNFLWYHNGVQVFYSNKTIQLQDSGLYYVESENFCGKVKSNSIQAYPVNFSNVLIPNVITPNDDGFNDYLIIDKSLAESQVNIINRWGKTVFTSSKYENNWNAPELSSGTYFIVVSNQCLPQGYKGWISVIK